MPMRTIHNSFSKGELDPSMLSRVDIDIYNKGARKLRNMIALWTGAARIAPGSKFIYNIIDRENANAPVTNALHINAVEFLYDGSGDVKYTIVLRKSGTTSAIDIFHDDARVATVTTPTFTNSQIKDVQFVVGHDRVLFLHPAHQIAALNRVTAHASWSYGNIQLSAFPGFDFTTIGGTQYRTSGFTFTLSATSGTSVTVTASSAIFNTDHPGGLLVGYGGVGRITGYTSTTQITISTLETFSQTVLDGNLCSLTEPMWSNNRGWPSRGVFYLNRLILGNSFNASTANAHLQNVVAISNAGVFDRFDDSTVDALSSFSVSFNGKGEQAVQSIMADDSIIFLTGNKTFAQSPLVETPLTASTSYFAPQGYSPASSIPGQTIDNQILFVSANKTQVNQLVYSTSEAKYLNYPTGLLSNHLFETIRHNGIWEPSNIEARLYMATQENGSMLMYNSLAQQNVSAWSLRTTRGLFRQVTGDGRQAHVIVKRQVNLGSSTFETTIDYAYLSDSTFGAYYNVTADLSSASSSYFTVFENQNDYIVLGDDIPFTAIDLTFQTVSSDDCELTFEYLDDNGFWNVFTPTDNTSGFTASASITWGFDDVLNWAPNTVNGQEETYWVRIRRTAETVTTEPELEHCQSNTGLRNYLERLDFDEYMDASISTTSDSDGLVTGLTHLAGHQVFAIEDGATTGPYFVDSSGETTITNKSATIKIGSQFKPVLVPMPLVAPTSEGDNTYAQKYVQDLFVDYVDSLYLRAGTGEELTDIGNLSLNNYTLGAPMEPQTSFTRIHPRGDWSPRQELTITQSQPGPMTIIGVGYHVEVT